LLAYVSSWLKCHYPAAFFAALINSQPMGFYQHAQLIRDARRSIPFKQDKRGFQIAVPPVQVLPIDVQASDWFCTLAPNHPESPTLRLGLCLVSGLAEACAKRIVDARRQQLFADAEDLVNRAQLEPRVRRLLAKADALRTLSGHRHAAHWQVQGIEDLPGMLASHSANEPGVALRTPREGEDILADYHSTGLTLRRHPLALLRPRLAKLGVRTAADLLSLAHGRAVKVAGLVLNRQRPQTAGGTMFMTLEDETGCHNLIVWQRVFAAQRAVALSSTMLIVVGEFQAVEGVRNIVVRHFHDASEWLAGLPVASRNFH